MVVGTPPSVENAGVLDFVAASELHYRDVVARLNTTLDRDLETLSTAEANVTNPCPECGRQVTRRKGKYGWFWSCTGYREGCTFTAEDHKVGMQTREVTDNGKLVGG